MDLSPGAIFAGLIFGLVGFAAWQVGRRRKSAGKMGLGLVLVGMPYVVPSPWVWLAGALLCVGLWFLP
jgi:hypothetical protein